MDRRVGGRRGLAVLAVLSIVLVACGVDRASDDVLAATTSTTGGSVEGADGDDPDGDDADDTTATLPSTTTTQPPAPATTGAPGEVALSVDFGDVTWEITHGELNEVVVPTQDNVEFVTLVFGGRRPPGFDVGVLTERLVSQAVLFELDELGVAVTDEDRDSARAALLGQVETLYAGQADAAAEAERLYGEVPYLPFLADYQANQVALTSALSEQAEPGEGSPCVRHILVDTEVEAGAVLGRLDAGEDFSDLAAELSTGPTGPNGGDLGCAPSGNYVSEFAAAVDSAALGEYVGPIQTQFGWHVLVVDRYEIDGRAIATQRLRDRLSGATVEVDEALGTWDAERLAVVPPEPDS